MTYRTNAVEEEPSVPVLVYLCADRLVTKQPYLVEGTCVPCSKARVQRAELAVQLLSSAFLERQTTGTHPHGAHREPEG
jgi:hypothetical protein